MQNTQTIIEYLRQNSINSLFSLGSFSAVWEVWRAEIKKIANKPTERQILSLGDCLYDIFHSTNSNGRGQSDVSSGGAAWEALICWYLNLCLIGRRTVVTKHNKQLLPTPIAHAITVNYDNFTSNTESDLIAVTFPDKQHYAVDKFDVSVKDTGDTIVPISTKRGAYNLLPLLNALTDKDFTELEIHIIQCKTNWNDNAQIPMLWDMVYSASAFRKGITIGKNGYSIKDIVRFSYSFVTVPTVKLDKIRSTSVAVQRVRNLSGGNYWGRPSQSGVAKSLQELLVTSLATGHEKRHLDTIKTAIFKLKTDHSYFRLEV